MSHLNRIWLKHTFSVDLNSVSAREKNLTQTSTIFLFFRQPLKKTQRTFSSFTWAWTKLLWISYFQTGCSNYLTPWWFLSNSMCASFYRQTITSKQILWAGCCTSYLRLSSSRNVGSFYKNHSSICVFLYLCICVCPVLGMLLRSFNCIFVFV